MANKFIFAFLIFSKLLVGESIEITTPKSGWRNAKGQKTEFRQAVHYPAVAVNTPEGHNKFALIKGQIKNHSKSEDPYTLVVNGLSMPMKVNENGDFQRPYLFSYGSNNVEIRNPAGTAKDRLQFFEVNPNFTAGKLSIVLSWDTDGTDLDLHVISPDGEHTYYGDRTAKNGAALDVDVTSGYGPEIYSTPTPVKGTYLVYVNYYGSGSKSDLTVAKISVVTEQNSLDEKTQTKITALRRPGDLNYVYSFIEK